MINLELPQKLQMAQQMSHQLANSVFRPIARKYDKIEHCDTPEELIPVGQMLKSMGMSSADDGSKAGGGDHIKNGANMMQVLATGEMSWGCIGLMLSIPGLGLGNAAIQAVGTSQQKEKFGKLHCAMAITEPGCGSDSAAVQTSAVLDGDQWVLNGEKIFATSASRGDAVVVWATLDKTKGKAAIKSFVVEQGTPGMQVVRCEDKMGLRVSDTAAIVFTDCRIPKENILGSPDIADTAEARKKAFGGVMQTFDNTRPPVGAMAYGVARAALEVTKALLEKEGIRFAYDRGLNNSSALQAEIYRMEAELEATRLLILKAAWMADNKQPNSKLASMCKAKAGRVGNRITLKCVELCGSLGYGEEQLLEKFARDSKILDIFEGTQQIQQLIIARNVLGKSSSELK
ncbi:MAG: acyl-CoA dehydrogenase [Pseudomonadales bacterium]|jgi:acyl-CoA dehydrogenase|nr:MULTISPECIES: acyl-CoA dehydrogenase family protein [unclassified Ketobacter]MAQ23620.1 acyl-CoA dehydrogenase [Pseudomonadales bacterium]MEC8809846.1 acyl-CoA dehydrogenase family protein [Pseudomonadota bacterium]TNC90819.1 MAG: acyl-CoA dehydrogenase [Alcanivorax sp.]HAG92853.1 acyl-CoA dehydrogenase [Gammaproteobacteria bacterium]RLT90020.1 MAG: acyl-CoA dehydrogenase [Ketobacter sp. GenoA1]|tara:strand:+ start:8909 stop:10114 length:1206 start_codon:yes stop_codon:yes gene_type:complete